MAKSTYRGTNTYNSIYSKLVETAKNKSTISYVDLALAARLPARGEYMAETLSAVLREIALECINKEQPVLPALVLKGGDDLPGNGFFVMMGELLGRSFAETEDRYSYWEATTQSIYSYWK